MRRLFLFTSGFGKGIFFLFFLLLPQNKKLEKVPTPSNLQPPFPYIFSFSSFVNKRGA